jgi:cholesterol transport system auxiliary component
MRLSIILLLGSLLALTSGCKLTRPSPIRHQFNLDVRNAAHTNSPSGDLTLQVRPFRVAAPFDQKSFVYRLKDQQYEVDYYHEFVTQPALLLTDIIRQNLEDSGPFKTVLSPFSLVEPDYFIEGQATELTGDFQDKTQPQAVMTIQFWLIQTQTKPAQLVWHQSYHATVPLPDSSPQALAAGWTKTLQQILDRLRTDLRSKIAP